MSLIVGLEMLMCWEGVAHVTREQVIEADGHIEERPGLPRSFLGSSSWKAWFGNFPFNPSKEMRVGWERKPRHLKDSWFKRPIESSVSIVLGPRFSFNVIKPQDLWIQQARTWSVFIFNYRSERAASRCLYLQHSGRPAQGLRGEGPQIVTLVNSSQRILSRGPGFDPVTKGRGPGRKGISDSRDNTVTHRGQSLSFVGICVIMGSIPYFYFCYSSGSIQGKRLALMWKTNIYNESIECPLATVTTIKCYRGNTQHAVTHIIGPILGALFYFSFEGCMCVCFFKCSQVCNLVLSGLSEHKWVFSCYSSSPAWFRAGFQPPKYPPARAARKMPFYSL